MTKYEVADFLLRNNAITKKEYLEIVTKGITAAHMEMVSELIKQGKK